VARKDKCQRGKGKKKSVREKEGGKRLVKPRKNKGETSGGPDARTKGRPLKKKKSKQ